MNVADTFLHGVGWSIDRDWIGGLSGTCLIYALEICCARYDSRDALTKPNDVL